MSRELPILFSTPMVRAIQDGRKTMTRRVMVPQAQPFDTTNATERIRQWIFPASRYQVGDMLWVKETWAIIDNTGIDGSAPYVEYKADKPNDIYPGDWPADEAKESDEAPRWKSGRFMFKKYARLWLSVESVRAERLQDISFLDARAEGILIFADNPDPETGGRGYNRGAPGLPMRYESTAAFSDLWDSINGKTHPWDSNPWVWVYGVRRISHA
jgi:hypothetical protein